MLIVFCGFTVPEAVTVRTSVPTCTGAVTSATGAGASVRQATSAATTARTTMIPAAQSSRRGIAFRTGPEAGVFGVPFVGGAAAWVVVMVPTLAA